MTQTPKKEISQDQHKEMTKVVSGLKDQRTSSKIRALAAAGNSRGDIARFLKKRYQHVRNVLITPLVGAKSK